MSTLVTKIASEERYKPLAACPQESRTIYFSQKFLKQDFFSKVYNNYPNKAFLDNFKDLNWTSVSLESIFETVQCTLRLTEQPIFVLTRKRL